MKCQALNCNKEAVSKGYCKMHYMRVWRHGTLEPKLKQPYEDVSKYCSLEGCNNVHHALGLCKIHYQQYKRGKLNYETPLKTIKENKPRFQMRASNTSGYRGVTWDKARRKWKVQIAKDGKKYLVGYFDDAKEGAIAYNIKSLELFGKDCYLNNVDFE